MYTLLTVKPDVKPDTVPRILFIFENQRLQILRLGRAVQL